MKVNRFIITVFMVGLLAGFSSSVPAGTFGTADTLRPGSFSLGLEPAFTFSPSSFTFFLHGGIGLTSTADLDLQLGLGSETYFGADVEFVLIRDSRRGPGLSLAAGAHGAGNFGLDTTLLLSNRFSTFTLFGSIDVDLEFVDSLDGTELFTPVYFDLGVSIPLARASRFLLEGNIGLTDSAASGLSGGLMFLF